MATTSTEITYTVAESISAKNITLTDTSSYGGSDLSWSSGDTRILVEITDAQGTIFRPLPATSSPDITGGGNAVSLSLPTDADGNVVRGINTVRLVYFDVNDAATQFERSYKFDNSYSSPTVDLDLSYSVINPIYFKAVDETKYDYNATTPTISGTLTLTHPQGLGSYVSNIDNTVKTLNTKVFYYSTDPDITSVVSLAATATYAFAGYYTDSASSNVNWSLVNAITGSKGIYVSGGSDGCDLYCCMKDLEQRLDTAISTGNATNETRLTALFNKASNLWQLVQNAYNCGKSSDAAAYTSEIKDLLQCTGDCGSSGTVSQVIGIGTTPNITRIGSAIMTADVTSYTFTNLIGYSYSDGDVIITVDGDDVESIDTYSIALNSITGEVSFGTTVYTGVKVAYHIIKP